MSDLSTALSRILRPLARVLIARGVAFPEFSDWAKSAYLAAAQRHFGVPGKRMTDSRLHLLTGLQRKDIKALRNAPAPAPPVSAGPLPRVVALWLATHADDTHPDDGPRPDPLPLRGPAPSFEALVAGVSRDIHARTVLDELVRLGQARVEDDVVHLLTDGFLPAGDAAALLVYLGANLGDHAEAAAGNVLTAPDPGPHFERAAHYNHLTPSAVAELDALSRQLLTRALGSINARAARLQQRDRGRAGATERFRAGAFLYSETEETDP